MDSSFCINSQSFQYKSTSPQLQLREKYLPGETKGSSSHMKCSEILFVKRLSKTINQREKVLNVSWFHMKAATVPLVISQFSSETSKLLFTHFDQIHNFHYAFPRFSCFTFFARFGKIILDFDHNFASFVTECAM